MALQTKDFAVTGKSSSGGITYTYILRVTENSTSLAGNTSNITVQAILKQSYSGTAFSTWYTGVSCTLNGNQIFSDYKQRSLSGTAETVCYTWTGDIAHNTDGSLNLTVGGKLWQSAYASFSPPAMTISESAGDAMVLTAIPRASGISAKDASITGSSRVTVSRYAGGFTHSIYWQFGSLSGYLAADGALADTEQIFSQTGLDFTIPESFYAQIPNAPTGVCTLTCTTYSGSTRMGSNSCQFTVRADPALCAPAVSGTVADCNPATLALTGDKQVLVRGQSDALCTITATGKNHASVTAKAVSGVTVTGDSHTVENIETGSILFTATDSRGYSGTFPVTLPLIPYEVLTCDASVKRTDPTSGKAVLTLSGKCYSGSFGAAENTLTVTCRAGEQTWTVTPTLGQDNSYQTTVTLSGLDYTQSHVLTVTAADALSTVTKTLTVQKGQPVFDWGEKDFQFHVPVTGAFEGSFSGVHLGTVYVGNTDQLTLQTRYSQFESSITGRQTILIFGAANVNLVHGVLTVWGNGSVQWSGTDGTSVSAAADGQVTVKLPSVAWDTFTLLSAEPFDIV